MGVHVLGQTPCPICSHRGRTGPDLASADSPLHLPRQWDRSVLHRCPVQSATRRAGFRAYLPVPELVRIRWPVLSLYGARPVAPARVPVVLGFAAVSLSPHARAILRLAAGVWG